MRVAVAIALLGLCAVSTVSGQNAAPAQGTPGTAKEAPPSFIWSTPNPSPLPGATTWKATTWKATTWKATTWEAREGATVVARPVGSTCPLGMEVRQGIGSRMMAVGKDGSKTEVFAARLHMLLRDVRPERGRRLVEATVTVRGINGQEEILPLKGRSDGGNRISRTLTVPLNQNGEPEFTAELRAPGFTATTWVELKSVTLDDGEVWSFTNECGVQPDPLMLISNR